MWLRSWGLQQAYRRFLAKWNIEVTSNSVNDNLKRAEEAVKGGLMFLSSVTFRNKLKLQIKSEIDMGALLQKSIQ